MDNFRHPDILIHHIGELVTLASQESGPRCGRDMDKIAGVKNGTVVVTAGRIVAAGPGEEMATRFKPGPKTRLIDAEGRLVSPGLVDAHTHLVFAGSREKLV